MVVQMAFPKGPKIEKNQSRLKIAISLENSISIEICQTVGGQKPGRFGSFAFAIKKLSFRKRVLLDTSRESMKMWQIPGVCVCPKSW